MKKTNLLAGKGVGNIFFSAHTKKNKLSVPDLLDQSYKLKYVYRPGGEVGWEVTKW